MAFETSFAVGQLRQPWSLAHRWRTAIAWLGPYASILRFILPVLLLLSTSRLLLIGVDSTHPLPGRDLTRTLPEFGNPAGPPPRAMMQYEQSYARLQGGILTVLLPNGTTRNFNVDGAKQNLTPTAFHDPELHRDALASVLMPAWIYRERRYRVVYPQ